jgi:hypothetical protein
VRADVVEAVLARAGAIPRDKKLAAEFLVGGAGNLIEQLVASGFDAALVLDAASEASGIPVAPSLWLDGVPRTARGVDAGLARRLGALVLGDIDGSLCIAYVDVEVAAAHDAYGFAPHEPFLCLARDLPSQGANADFLVDATIDGSVDATINIARLRAEVDEPTLPIAAPSSMSSPSAPRRPAPTFGPPTFEPLAPVAAATPASNVAVDLDPPMPPSPQGPPSTPQRAVDLDPALPARRPPAPSTSTPSASTPSASSASSSASSSSSSTTRQAAAALAPRDLTRPLLAGVLGAAVVGVAMLVLMWPTSEAPAPAIAVSDGAVDVDARQAALLAQSISLNDDAAIALLSRGIALDPGSAGALDLLVERARRYQHCGAVELAHAEIARIARRGDAARVQGALDALRAAAGSAPIDGGGIDRQPR